jgi:hypothetical protein
MKVPRKVTSKVYSLTKSGNHKGDELRTDSDASSMPLKCVLTKTLGRNRYIYNLLGIYREVKWR